MPGAIAETCARDPLIGTFILMLVAMLALRLLFGRYPIWRAVARVIFLLLLTLLILHNGIVPYRPLQSTGTPFGDAIAGTLKIVWWPWAAWFLGQGLIEN